MFSAFTHVGSITVLLCGGILGGGILASDRVGACPDGGVVAGAPVDWSAPVTLGPGQWPLSAAVSPRGDLAAVWQTEDGPQLAIRPQSGVWSAPERVAPYAGLAFVAYDGAGDMVLAWGDHRPRLPSRVRVKVLTDGVWGRAETVARRKAGAVGVVDMAVNARGDVVVGWQWEQWPKMTGFVSRGRAGRTWTTGLRVPDAFALDVALGDGGLAAVMVQRATVDPETSAAEELTWAVARQYRQRPWSRLVTMQRLTDIGPPWPGPGGVFVDAAGRTTAAWDDQSDGGGWRIVAARARLGESWRAPGVLGRRAGWGESQVRVSGTQRGDVLVTFVRQPARRELMAVRWLRPGWQSPVSVSGVVDYVADWDAAVDPAGVAAALWTPARGPGSPGRGVRAALDRADGTWRAPQRLSSAETPDGHARVLATNGGLTIAVWSQMVDGSLVIRVRTQG